MVVAVMVNFVAVMVCGRHGRTPSTRGYNSGPRQEQSPRTSVTGSPPRLANPVSARVSNVGQIGRTNSVAVNPQRLSAANTPRPLVTSDVNGGNAINGHRPAVLTSGGAACRQSSS